MVDLVKAESGQLPDRVVEVVADELEECLLRVVAVTPAGLLTDRTLKREPRPGRHDAER